MVEILRVAGDVRLEKFEEGEIESLCEIEKVDGCCFRRNDWDIGETILNRFASDILEDGLIFEEIVNRRNRFGLSESHHGRYGFESSFNQFLWGIDQICVREFYSFAAPRQFHEEIVFLYFGAQTRPWETFAMMTHKYRRVDAGKHSCLTSC